MVIWIRCESQDREKGTLAPMSFRDYRRVYCQGRVSRFKKSLTPSFDGFDNTGSLPIAGEDVPIRCTFFLFKAIVI